MRKCSAERSVQSVHAEGTEENRVRNRAPVLWFGLGVQARVRSRFSDGFSLRVQSHRGFVSDPVSGFSLVDGIRVCVEKEIGFRTKRNGTVTSNVTVARTGI